MIRIGLIAEDVSLVYFLCPAIETISECAGVPSKISAIEKTKGCRPERLKQLIQAVRPKADILVVGIDSAGPTHATRTQSARQKRRALMRRLGAELEGTIMAIAAPCVEMWLLSDPTAFRDGIQAGLGIEFDLPSRWPIVRSERQAKAALGLILKVHAKTSLLMAGFEYSDQIVRKMRLTNSPNESLRDWARDFENRLKSLHKGTEASR
jgi:hypothetical protein